MFRILIKSSFATILFLAYALAAGSASSMIASINLANGFQLVPYQEEHKEGFKQVVNDPAVYPHVGDGNPWSDEKIDERHAMYIKANATTEKYIPETFCAFWMLLTPSQEVIGRAGFLPEKGLLPAATQGFVTLKGSCHRKGLGTQCCEALMTWFDDNIIGGKLRMSIHQDNVASMALATKFGFKPLMESGKQLTTLLVGKEYMLFEKGC